MAATEGDVVVYYKLIPTQDSIEATAGKVGSELDKVFTGGKGKKKMRDIFDQALDAFRTINPRSYPTERFKAMKRLGEDKEEGGLGGKVVPLLSGILAATMVVGAFFDAVGPIIKVVMKLLSFVILIFLLPLIKALLPIIPAIFKAMLALAKFFSIALTPLEWLSTILKPFLDVVGELALAGANFLKTIVEDIPKNFSEFIQKLPEIIGNILTGVFDFASWLLNNISTFFSTAVFDFTTWVTDNILTPLGQVFKDGIETILSFDFDKTINYFMAKFIKLIIDSVNGIIGLMKTIKFNIPKMSVPLPFGGSLQVFPGWNFDPFGSMSTISTPASVSSAINAYEKPPASTQQQSINVNNTYNITGGDKLMLQQMLEELKRKEAQSLRTKTSYMAGTFA